MGNGREQKGFTLIETLVAIMILAICLTVILQLFSGGMKAARISGDYTRAVFHAREKMEEILLIRKMEEGSAEGRFDDGYGWAAEIALHEPSVESGAEIALHEPSGESGAENPSPATEMKLFRITVSVYWDTDSRRRSFDLETLHLAEAKTRDERS